MLQEINNFNHFLQLNMDASVIYKDNHFLQANKKALELFSCESLETLQSYSFESLSSELQDDRQDSSQKFNAIMQALEDKKQMRFVWKIRDLKANVFDAEISVSLIENEKPSAVYMQIRKVQENVEYKNLKERYELAIEGSKEGVWDWNVLTSELYLSPVWKAMLGYEDDELESSFESFEKNIHSDDFKLVMTKVEEHFQTRNEGIDLIVRMKHKQGHYIWVHDKGKAVFDESGKPVRMVGFHSDVNNILEQKKRLSLLEKAYENTNDSILIVNAKTGKIVDVNAVSMKQLHYTKEELLQKYIWDIKEIELSLEQWSAKVEKIKTQESFLFNMKHKRKDGSVFPVEIHDVVIAFEQEEYVVSTVRDISLQEKYRHDLIKQKAFLDAILDNISDGIVSCDENGELKYFNKALRELHGIDSEALPPQEWSAHYSLYHADGKTLMKMEEIPLFIALKEGFIKDTEMVIAPKKADNKTLIANGQRMLDDKGNSLGAVVSMHDITKRKEAMIKAEHANASKSLFLANMSHEIRTPMNAILGFTELLAKTNLTTKQQEYINTVHVSARSLLDLINDILDLSKIESGKMELNQSEVNISSILGDMEDLFKLKAQEKGLALQFECDEELCILSDDTRLRQIMLNLIGNAIKFMDEGKVEVEVNLEENLRIKVKDSGVGVKPDERDKIFNSFEQQSDQDYRTYGGTGLGLSICKRLSHLLNGDIWVEANEPKGSVFVLELKDVQRIQKCEVEKQHEVQEKELPEIVVLIVDDVITNRILIDAYFDETKVKTLEASNGKEAVQMAKEHMPDIILMDIKMPVMGGIEAMKILKSDPQTSQIPISALTADIVDKEKSSITEYGFDMCMSKPIAKETLFEGILVLAHS